MPPVRFYTDKPNRNVKNRTKPIFFNNRFSVYTFFLKITGYFFNCKNFFFKAVRAGLCLLLRSMSLYDYVILRSMTASYYLLSSRHRHSVFASKPKHIPKSQFQFSKKQLYFFNFFLKTVESLLISKRDQLLIKIYIYIYSF